MTTQRTKHDACVTLYRLQSSSMEDICICCIRTISAVSSCSRSHCSSMCPPHSQIVSYNSRHFEQIKYICKDVYGGHDYLPDQVENYSRASDKAVLVLEGGAGTVLGIGVLQCC